MGRYELVSCLCFCVICVTLWSASNVLPIIILQWYSSLASCLLASVLAYFLIPLLREKILHHRVSPQNKAVLITGCDSGFGNLLAQRLDAAGFNVFASCLDGSAEGARSLKEKCSNRLQVFELDVTNDRSVEKAVQYVTQNLGILEFWALVNNAGIFEGYDIAWSPIDSFKKSMEVNAVGVARVTKAFLPLLMTSHGRIVTITSILGRISFPQFGTYCMSKYAAVSFCEVLRHEMAPWGIKVVSIEPELFRTPMTDVKAALEKLNTFIEKVPSDLKSMYGDDYFNAFKEQVVLQGSYSCPNLQLVIDSLFDAVTLEEPCSVYRPRRDFFATACLRVMENLPRSLNDFIMYTYKYLSKFPQPKGVQKTLENGKL